MAKMKFVLDKEGLKRNVLQAQFVYDLIAEKCAEKAIECGEGYENSIVVGKNRVIGEVKAATIHASRSNRKHNTLEKVVFSSND